MEYRLLGPLQVVGDDGTEVSVPAPKRRALLAMLLIHANETVATGTLADALWDGAPPPAAIPSLRAHVSRLRREIGPVITTSANGYAIAVSRDALDTRQFEERLTTARHQARSGQLAQAAASYRGALGMWRGRALADFEDDPFAQPERQRLDELRLSAVEERIEVDLGLGRHDDLIAELEGLVGVHPLRERAWDQLMRALYRSGRQADALAAYRRLRATLVEELGIDPSPELQQLEVRILQQDPELRGPAGGSRQPPVRLPVPLSGLTGRQRELTLAVELLRAHRLLTLAGPGGVGKTRLAVAVAQALVDEQPDGVLFVDLSGIRDPSLVMAAIGEATGGGERPEAVIGNRELLLILDNFEQVLAAAAGVATLLARCGGLRILITSRAPLQLRGEQLLDVPPLSAESALSLFRERARAALLDDGADDVVAEIVMRLDNLPLAIELAAARVRLLSPEALRDRLGERLGVLEAQLRDMPARHRTLRETIAWSYELLSDAGKSALRRCSVFPGSFDLPAALAVTQGGLNDIAELVDQSLLRRSSSRYQMLDTIREFAATEAAEHGELEAARARHLEHYLGVALSTGRETTEGGPLAQNAWQVMCRTERNNLRLAFDTAVAREEWETIKLLYRAVGMFWLLVGAIEEGERWGEKALEAAAHLDRDAEIHVLMMLSEFPRLTGDHARAIRLKERALELARGEAADPALLAVILVDVADSYGALGEYRTARTLLDEAAGCRERSTIHDPLGKSHTLSGFVELALYEGRGKEALELDDRVAEIEAAMPEYLHPDWIAESTTLRAKALQAAGHAADAERLFREALRMGAAIEFRMPMTDALEALAALTSEGDPAAAARLLGMADRVRAESSVRLWDAEQHERTIVALRLALGDDGLARLRADGHALPLAAMAEAALGV